MNSVSCLVLARGGSKGIPGKNLKKIGGQTLVTRAVLASKGAGFATYLSTDDPDIALDGLSAGAVIIDRPKALASDTSSSEDAIIHALHNGIEKVEYLVFVQPTSPFINSTDIQKALEIAVHRDISCVFAATDDWGFRWTLDNGSWSPVGHPLNRRPRRQELAPQVRETGAFYVIKVEDFLRVQSRFCGACEPYLVDSRFAIDIDTFDDLDAAEALETLWVRAERGGSTPQNFSFSNLKAVAYDFDGVMTPNTAMLSEDGSEFTTIHRGDGYGVRLLNESGLKQSIFSLDASPLALHRAKKLKIEGFNRIEDKLKAVREWASSHEVGLEQVAYLGNDLNDLQAIQSVGLGVAVSDAHPDVLRAARLVLSSKGGSGAIREFAEIVLNERRSMS